MLADRLPDWLANYVRETSDELQVPQDAVALLSLGAVSAAINGGASITPTGTWTEPVSLYTLVLLVSGEGKSPAFDRLIDPVRTAFEEVSGVRQSSDARYQSLRNRLQRKHVKSVEQRVMRQVEKGSMSLEEAIAEAAEAERQVNMFHNSIIPLKVLTDVTPAGLMDSLEDNNGRVVIASDEAEGLMNFRGGSKEAILKGYDGATMTQARRGSGEVTIARPVLTMMLAMQPTILAKLGADMVNRGVMPRFLISYPESMVGVRESRPRLVSVEAEEEYLEQMTRIVRTYSDKTPKLVGMERMAVKEIGTWRDEIEPLLAPDGELATVANWASKVRGGTFVRLAAILAIASGRESVTVGDCTNAKAILRALMVDAKRAFATMGASFADDDLIHLMAVIGRLGTTFSKRDVMRKSNRFMAAPPRCTAALDRAVSEGLLSFDGKTYTVEGESDQPDDE